MNVYVKEVFDWLKIGTTVSTIIDKMQARNISHRVARALSFAIPGTERSHLSGIRSKLQEMPFIYENYGQDLVADYVQTRMRSVDLEDLGNAPTSYQKGSFGAEDIRIIDLRVASDMIRYNRACLIFGYAGVGKTTFVSYSILSIIDHLLVRGFYPFGPTERLVPFFVPLKAVDESLPLPILSYVLRSSRFVASIGGQGRLLRLARKGHILLVLDGYDEVQSSSEPSSTLRVEIDALFNGDLPIKPPGAEPLSAFQKYFYANFGSQPNRIWLTSRKDFYRSNRLSIESKRSLQRVVLNWIRRRYEEIHDTAFVNVLGDPGIASVEILGIWERRDLVKKIFTKYRKEKNARNIDEIRFLQFVDTHYDDETRELSQNPLFLTVMCHLYIQYEILGKPRPQGATLRDLVDECTKLLIRQLDEYRMERSPISGRELTERQALPEEKKKFLRYFASRLFYQEQLAQKNVFTSTDLIDVLTQYLGEVADVTESQQIRNYGIDSFISQLIRQGVFVIVDVIVGKTFYDFPHRRFREMLAIEYWDNEERVQECLERLTAPNFGEFAVVFFAYSRRFQDVTLRAILYGIDESPRGERLASVALICLEKTQERPGWYSPDGAVTSWIKHVADKRLLHELPMSIIRSRGEYPKWRFKPDENLLSQLKLGLRKSIGTGDQVGVRMYATFIAQIAPKDIQQISSELLLANDLSIARLVCQIVLKHQRQVALQIFSEPLTDGQFELICRESLTNIGAIEEADKSWWLDVLSRLPKDRSALLQRLAAEQYIKLPH
jgi:hypothetical protein